MRKTLVVAATLGLLFYLTCVNHTETYEIGILWDPFAGQVSVQDLKNAGIHVTAPWVRESTIDTRPMRVCITSAGRGYNCKLVQFVPEAWQEFVAVQGFHYWWWSNRFSFNWGHEETYRGMRDLMRGYAFSVKKYEFVSVEQ